MTVAVVLWTLLGLALVGVFVFSVFVRRYRDTDRPQRGWRSTDEVFSDPSTKRLMRVWLDEQGTRHYVAEGWSSQAP